MQIQKKRRWLRHLALPLAAAAALVYFLPALACRTPLRPLLLRLVRPDIAAGLQVESLSAGWFQTLEARGVRYRSDEGEFTAERVSCNRTLLDLLKEPTDWGHVQITAPHLTVETTRPSRPVRNVALPARELVAVPEETPDRTASPFTVAQRPAHRTADRPLTVAIDATQGTLTLVDRAGGTEWTARQVEFQFDAPTSPDQANFRLQARMGDRDTTAHVTAHGSTQWPLWSLTNGLLDAHVDLVGVDSATAAELLSLAWYRTSDSQPAGRTTHLQLAGSATGTIDLRRVADGRLEARTNLEVQDCSVRDPSSGFEWSNPAVSASAMTSHHADSLRVDSLRLRGENLNIDAAGTVADLRGEARADLSGTAECDWDVIGPRLRSVLSGDVAVSGRERRPWRLRGPLRGRSLTEVAQRVEGDISTHLDSVRAWDFELGPMDLTAHWRKGSVELDPITAAFQGGQVTARPTVKFVGDLPMLRLAPGRVLDHVVIDPKFCDWILRYVDPLVATAGSLRGQLSLEIEQLEIPLTPDGAWHGSLEGRLLLENVEFVPGESLRELLTQAGIQTESSLQTSHVIAVRMENGRVYHSGLALPVRDGEVTLDGWVGLDHTIHIRVGLPVTEQMLGKDKRLYRLLRGQRIEVPVTGSLDHVRVNEHAFAQSVQRLIQIAVRDGLGSDDPLRGLLRRALR